MVFWFFFEDENLKFILFSLIRNVAIICEKGLQKFSTLPFKQSLTTPANSLNKLNLIFRGALEAPGMLAAGARENLSALKLRFKSTEIKSSNKYY